MEQLFAEGKSFSVFPLKVIYMHVEPALDFPVKIGVGTSTRYFKKAVDRNRIKRLLRENYRLNKLPLHELVDTNKKQLAVFFLYIDKTMEGCGLLPEKMKTALNKLTVIIGQSNK